MGQSKSVTNKGDHEEWVEEALGILKPITDGGDITNEFQGVEKETMRNLMENIRELARYLNKGFPDDLTCECEDDRCPAWEMGYDKAEADNDL